MVQRSSTSSGFGRVTAAMALEALCLSVASFSASHAQAAKPTKLPAPQLAAMSACSDQEHAGQPAPAVCRPFFPGVSAAAPLVLTDRQEARMAECVDQQQGRGTAGAPDTCADFVGRTGRHKR